MRELITIENFKCANFMSRSDTFGKAGSHNLLNNIRQVDMMMSQINISPDAVNKTPLNDKCIESAISS